MKKMEILVLRFDLLGDTILTLPFLENLRKNYPNAKITVAASNTGYPALKDCPFIDKVVAFNLKKEIMKINFIFKINIILNENKQIEKFIKDSLNKYDKCFLLTENPLAYKIAYESKIPELIGFCPRPMPVINKLPCSMSFVLKHYNDDCPEHVVKRQLSLLKIAVFCDRDFWHGHNWAIRGLASLEEELECYSQFWKGKITGNICRDNENTVRLQADGWTVIRFCESDRKADVGRCANVVESVYRDKIPNVGG